MSRTGSGLLLPVLLSLWALGAGCLEPRGGEPRVDSVTHFLRACVTDAQCPDGLTCECGTCTTTCAIPGAVDTCGTLGPGASCVAAGDLKACKVLPASGPSLCAVPCATGASCGGELDCALERCYGEPECPPGYDYDARVAYCVGPWTGIEPFSGDQRCGPDYGDIRLPFGMNEFRPKSPSVVTGGFLNVISNREQPILWTISPNGETNVCNHLWGDDLGTWFQGVRRTAGDVEARCTNPSIPPPLGFFFRFCGIYDFDLEGRAIVPPLAP